MTHDNAPLTFEVITIFPEIVEAYCRASLIGRAQARKLVAVRCTDPRSFATDKRRSVDDAPFGGGAGMVMRADCIVAALETVEAQRGRAHRILLTPSAPRFDQNAAVRLAGCQRIVLICGRYEGIDDRVREHFVDEVLSIGDFVLNGGELGALVLIEAISRLRPGVLGNDESAVTESFAVDTGHRAGITLLEHPHYTRPVVLRGHAVPAVLQAGNHRAIAMWRLAAALDRTALLRPDLLGTQPLNDPRAPLPVILVARDRAEQTEIEEGLRKPPHADQAHRVQVVCLTCQGRELAPHAPVAELRKSLRRLCREWGSCGAVAVDQRRLRPPASETHRQTSTSVGSRHTTQALSMARQDGKSEPSLLGFSPVGDQESPRASSEGTASLPLAPSFRSALAALIWVTGAHRPPENHADGARPSRPGALILLDAAWSVPLLREVDAQFEAFRATNEVPASTTAADGSAVNGMRAGLAITRPIVESSQPEEGRSGRSSPWWRCFAVFRDG